MTSSLQQNLGPFEWVNKLGTKMFNAEYKALPNTIVCKVAFKKNKEEYVELGFQLRGRQYVDETLIKAFCESAVNTLEQFDEYADWREVFVQDDKPFNPFEGQSADDIAETMAAQMEVIDSAYNRDLN